MNPKSNTISKSNLSYLIETIVKGIMKELDSSDQSSNDNKKAEKVSSLALKKAKGNKNLAYKIIQRGIDKCNEPEFKKTLQTAVHILQGFAESTNEETGTGAVSPITKPTVFVKKNKSMEEIQPMKPLGGMEETLGYNIPRIPGKFFNSYEIKLESGMDEKTATDIASRVWDIMERPAIDDNGVWNFRTRGNAYCCAVGMYKGQPAILNKTTTSGIVNLLIGAEIDKNYPSNPDALTEMTTTGGGGDSSAGTTGYNIPGFLSKKGGSKAGVEGSEKLGYKLTGIGKDEMERPADKLIEEKKKK